MAILRVNPTRMELLRLKKKIKVAQRGHKLLKEKRDGLMKEFLSVISRAKSLREEIDEKMKKAFKCFIYASAYQHPIATYEAILASDAKVDLEVKIKNIMSVKIPEFNISRKGDIFNYSFMNTSGNFDLALKYFDEILQFLVKLVEIEKIIDLMAEEIEKTRRRVNALEHILIPNLKDTSKYILLKLDELERGSKLSLMRLKEIS